jgi:hypothetical protein
LRVEIFDDAVKVIVRAASAFSGLMGQENMKRLVGG